MFVARCAAWAAVALAVIGLLYAAIEGEAFLAAGAISALFPAALFWSLADIGDRLGPPVSGVADGDNMLIAEDTNGDFAKIDENGPSFFEVSRIGELERKLAAARVK